MYSRMSWARIKELFSGEWVELVNFDWDWNSPYPRWANVRNHASDRKELLTLIEAHGEVENSVVLYIGSTALMVNRDSSVAAL